MNIENKATTITLLKKYHLGGIPIYFLNVSTPQMRTFHMTWWAFFIAFFGWFGIAPLMAYVREDLSLTKEQIGNTIIASVLITVFVRMLIGPLCDRIGPRITYSGLLILGSIPVMMIGLANSYETFLLFRLAIGAIGASFVITQYHTSVMFAPNCVGTANATTAGWGNLGGGVTQFVTPVLCLGILSLGVSETLGWRITMVIPGIVLFITGILYYLYTQDAPDGNYRELRAAGKLSQPGASDDYSKGAIKEALFDYRVWALFICYGACFGVELTINNIAALYFMDEFGLSVFWAGTVAASFGLMNIFARTLGGIFSDMSAQRWSLTGRVYLMFSVLAIEGLALILFSQMATLALAIVTLVIFSLFVQMSEGATYGIVPFINKRALGTVAGIIGAGGNAGAVAAGFLFRSEALSYQMALFYLGLVVLAGSFLTLLVRFTPAQIEEERLAFEKASGERAEAAIVPGAAS